MNTYRLKDLKFVAVEYTGPEQIEQLQTELGSDIAVQEDGIVRMSHLFGSMDMVPGMIIVKALNIYLSSSPFTVTTQAELDAEYELLPQP